MYAEGQQLRHLTLFEQMLLEVMVSVLHRAAAVAGIKLLPAEWIPLAPSKLRALLMSYQTGAREGAVACVDWRRVMWSLANVPPASVEELRSLVQRAKTAGASLDAVPSAAARALPLWFEGLPSPATYTDSNGQVVVKGHERGKLKAALMDIFTVVAPDGRESVNLLHLILYACADKQKEGVEKAVKVLGSTQGHVDAQTLLPILSLGRIPVVCVALPSVNPSAEENAVALRAACSWPPCRPCDGCEARCSRVSCADVLTCMSACGRISLAIVHEQGRRQRRRGTGGQGPGCCLAGQGGWHPHYRRYAHAIARRPSSRQLLPGPAPSPFSSPCPSPWHACAGSPRS